MISTAIFKACEALNSLIGTSGVLGRNVGVAGASGLCCLFIALALGTNIPNYSWVADFEEMHPNYFGEIFQWWCAFALAYNSSEAASGYMDPLWWACILSPLFTMHILLNIGATGISNAEGKNLKRYYEKCPEEYAEYRKNTSILIPMVGYRHIPLSVKRALLFEFERYEYRPGGGSEVKKD
ncbi:unnamed protein product [Symbiodinium microadriaticum]|nr:unnamed protein product [Symbiodinium microadriaticum]